MIGSVIVYHRGLSLTTAGVFFLDKRLLVLCGLSDWIGWGVGASIGGVLSFLSWIKTLMNPSGVSPTELSQNERDDTPAAPYPTGKVPPFARNVGSTSCFLPVAPRYMGSGKAECSGCNVILVY